MTSTNTDVILIGAGLSGLACALELQKGGLKPLLLEKGLGPGGRVFTDEYEGFLLDRGFQVFLDAYPVAGSLFDLEALQLRPFEPGAMVFSQGDLHRVMDIFRRPKHLISSALAPVGNYFDKALVARLRLQMGSSNFESLAGKEELTTENYLRRFGFSEKMIDNFFRSFYGGVFLERGLQTSSHIFEFTFKMFTQGYATLPAKGMGQLPAQLAAQLPDNAIRYQSEVTSISGNTVLLSTGECFTANHIIIAAPNPAKLLPDLRLPKPRWRAVTNVYFSAPESPLQEPIIALDGEGKGLVNNVAVLSDVAPDYAPDGKALISVSVLGNTEQSNLPEKIVVELRDWFGGKVDQWEHLRTYRIPQAQPEQLPGAKAFPEVPPPHYLCGDYLHSASIEGAIISGQQAAKRVLAA